MGAILVYRTMLGLGHKQTNQPVSWNISMRLGEIRKFLLENNFKKEGSNTTRVIEPLKMGTAKEGSCTGSELHKQ